MAGTTFKDVLSDDDESPLARRKKELENMGEGAPGEKGSTRSKDAVARARAAKDDSNKVKDMNGNTYDRLKQFEEDTKDRR